jgi:hypothetical protein
VASLAPSPDAVILRDLSDTCGYVARLHRRAGDLTELLSASMTLAHEQHLTITSLRRQLAEVRAELRAVIGRPATPHRRRPTSHDEAVQ